MSFSGGTAPADTRLIVIDADAAGESIDFTVPAGNPVLAPLEFWDSTDIVPAGGGGPTHYAVWDAPNTTLNPSSINGNRNATVFDISGFGTFDMTTSFNDGYVIGVFSPVVVPEPSSALLAGLGALGLLARRKR